MRRFITLSTQFGSTAVETLMLVALAFLLVAAVVGVMLVSSLGQRSTTDAAGGATSPAASVASVATLEIACGAEAASVEGEAVDATSGGVPVRVVGDDGAVLIFTSSVAPAYRMHVFEASGSYHLPLAPGPWSAGCAVSGVIGDAVALGVFEVRDPDQVYLRTRPECPASGCCDEIVDLPPGFADDGLGTLHDGLADAGVRPTDTIERAAYADSTFSAQPPSPLVYRVVRDLQIVARLDVAGEGDTWSVNVYGCPAG